MRNLFALALLAAVLVQANPTPSLAQSMQADTLDTPTANIGSVFWQDEDHTPAPQPPRPLHAPGGWYGGVGWW